MEAIATIVTIKLSSMYWNILLGIVALYYSLMCWLVHFVEGGLMRHIIQIVNCIGS